MLESNIKILWNDGKKWHTSPYHYVANRATDSNATLFYNNCMVTLDFLYETKAMEIEFENGQTINILEEFINRSGKCLTIRDGNKNTYSPSTDTITFFDTDGAMYRKDLRKPWSRDNTGKCSSASLLGHEFIHAYHEQFTPQEYIRRKAQKILGWKVKFPHFPNQEEVLVTKNLANQIIKKLGEDEREHYKRNYYPTVSPITTEPVKVDGVA